MEISLENLYVDTGAQRVKNENFWTCSLDVISPEINGGITKCQLFSQATGQLVFSYLSDSYGWRVRAGYVDVDH